jgi:hypothetical protein
MVQFNIQNVEPSYHSKLPAIQRDDVGENAMEDGNKALMNEKIL